MNHLITYGWNTSHEQAWQQLSHTGLTPARVIADYGQNYIVASPQKIAAKLSGSLMHKLKSIDMPKIGDWVAIQHNHQDKIVTIQAVLPRTSEIVRGQAGRLIDKQVIAANVDLAFIMQPLDHDFSPERLERYIFQLSSQNIKSIIILNKADKAKHIEEKKTQLDDLEAQIITASILHDEDITAIEALITPGSTIVILGSSGAGKSTLTNRLLGEDIQATQAVRERDSKGRHTTVHRELFVLPRGGMIIDTPGIRELQLWGDEQDLEKSFPEIFAAARQCHYSNCTHTVEDRCFIQTSLNDGSISKKRYKIYQNFKKELRTLEARREFIQDRRSQQSKESTKRRRRRHHNQDTTDYKNF